MNEIPKFHETFNPILDILSKGEILKHKEMINLVIEKFYSKLPQDLLNQRTKSGDILINNRIAWGKSYLKKAGFIKYPVRGTVQITELGRSALTKNLELKDLENQDNFLTFYEEEKKENLNQDLKSSSPQDLIDLGIKEIESQTKNELFDKLKDIDPYNFEKIILRLLNKMGYGEFIETSKSSDGGIDGIINEDALGLEKIYIQAKRYKENKVREIDIRNFIGAMSGDTRKGVFVTTSTFDEKAIKKAKEAHHSIILVDGKMMVNLMYLYKVGIQIKEVFEIKEIDEDFFESLV
jgi:restriction system protein